MEEVDCFSEDESVWNEAIDISQLCRICANPNEYLIPIFHGEGKEHELETKISKHLPIKVSEGDELPANVCYQCASTLIAWHDITVRCLEADEKLKAASNCKAGHFLKVTSEIDKKNYIETKHNQNIQQNSVSITKTNKTIYVLQENDPKFISSDDIDKVVEKENISAVKNEIIEDKTTDSRYMGSFKSYHQTHIAMRMLFCASKGSVFCMICGKKRGDQMSLIKHVYFEHKMLHCDAKFTNEQELGGHILTLGDPIRKSPCKYKNSVQSNKLRLSAISNCEICSQSFNNCFDLKNHKIECHSNKIFYPNNENSDNDSKCKKRSSSQNIILPVELIESKIKTFMTDCKVSHKLDYIEKFQMNSETRFLESKLSFTSCGYSCNLKTDFVLQHSKNSHQSESSSKEKKPHKCDVCCISYLRKANLQRHIHKVHFINEFDTTKKDLVEKMNVDTTNQVGMNVNNITIYCCKICGRQLRTKKGFVRHLRVHTGERPFTCHICGKQYCSNTDLTRHLKCVHEGVKKYRCDICGHNFANRATANDHRRTHTGEKPFMCDICGKSFPTSNSIYIHRRIHTNYFPHKCHTCERKFRRKQQLIHHTRTHTGEKPYACDVCGKCFAVKDEVTRHKMTHSTEKPYMCPNCGFAFAQKRYLLNHLKTHHSV